MQELAGKLKKLDPHAADPLTVITFFDTLVVGGAGVEAVVRAATVLSGTAAGAQFAHRTVRVREDGTVDPRPAESIDEWHTRAEGPEITVWLERHGPPHANDAMILERLALSATIAHQHRTSPRSTALADLLEPSGHSDDQVDAARRLGIDRTTSFWVMALPGSQPDPRCGPTTILTSPNGPLRAVLTLTSPDAVSGPTGIAEATYPTDAAQAWDDAQIALRLCSDSTPVVNARDLGAMIILARHANKEAAMHPDVRALLDLDPRSQDMLDVLVKSESVRSAAVTLSLHHSSMQARHENWTRKLGYDPRSSDGRARYEAARLLARLAIHSNVSRETVALPD